MTTCTGCHAEWDDAVEALERALGFVSANRNVEGWARSELARTLLGRGELDRAEREAQAGVDVAQASHSRCDELRAHLALAHTHLRRADPAARLVEVGSTTRRERRRPFWCMASCGSETAPRFTPSRSRSRRPPRHRDAIHYVN